MKRSSSALATALACSLALVAAVPPATADDEPARDGRTQAAEVSEPPEMTAKAVDLFIRAAWREEGLEAHELCSDEEYVRRVYLDIVGSVPNAGQVQEFVDDRSADKRARLVDQLLDTPGYARHFANLWGGVLVGQGTNQNNREYNASLFRNWLEENLAENRPYDQLVRAMLTGTGTIYTNAAVNWSGRRNHNPTDLAGAVSKHFLGVQIQCAQCHDHPYEDITQKDFQGVAAFWGRTTQKRVVIPYETFNPRQAQRYKRQYEQDVERMTKEGVPEAQARQQARRRQPRSISLGDISGGSRFPKALQRRREQQIGEIASTKPKFLLDDVYADSAGENRRQALAEWIVDPENPYTARALANRYWGWLLGRGFAHPVDDFSSVNIPSVPAALEVLSKDTADSGFDLKRLVRVIAATEAYQLTAKGTDRTPHGEEFFAVGPLKPLSPQQLFDSLQVSLGVEDSGSEMSGIGRAMSSLEMGRGRGGMMMTEESERSRTQRMLRGMANQFFQTFDDDEGEEAASFEGTIPQGLFLMNSQVVNGLLTDRNVSIVPKVYDLFSSETARIKHLFLRTLSREPTREELQRFVRYVQNPPTHMDAKPDAKPKDGKQDKKSKRKKRLKRRKLSKEDRRTAAYSDVLWALISTTEYGTNH